MREQGYYWVKYDYLNNHIWMVAFWAGTDWELNGEFLTDDNFVEIDEKRIVRGVNSLIRDDNNSIELYEFQKLNHVNGIKVKEVATYHNDGDSNAGWPLRLNLVSNTIRRDR